MSKLIFKATASLKALQPTWQDGTVYEVDPIEAKRLLKSYPDNFAKYDPKKHDAQPEHDDDSGDDHDTGDGSQPIALEDVLKDDDALLNVLLDNGVQTMIEAQQLTNKDLKSMGVKDKEDREKILIFLSELKPDSDKSEPGPDNNR